MVQPINISHPMRGKRVLFSLLLLSFFLVVAAEDGIRLRSCRPMAEKSCVPLRHMTRRVGGTNPYIGDRHQLVVLVSFSDQSFKGTEEETMESWGKIFNAENLSEEPYVGSIHDYFYAQSYKQFNLTFDLYYIPLSESCVKYRSEDPGYGDEKESDENSRYLVYDIVDVLATKDIDWSQYDWDDDGYINQLLIVYAGKGMNAGGGANTIWPHQWWLSEHEGKTTRTVTSGGQSYTVDCYCCVQEEINYLGIKSSFGTICHEFSHCFGFPDFYVGGSTVREWDLMDYGNNNGQGYCPAGYSAHERMLMGWLEPTELTSEATITAMPALGEESKAYLIRNDGYANEYYIIENRQPQVWDASLPGSGIVVFHIDYDKDVWQSGTPNVGTKRYCIIPANNNTSTSYQSGWAYPYGDNNSLTNESEPAATLYHNNADGTKLMSKPLTNLSLTDGLASFDFMGGSTGILERKMIGQPKILFDFGPIYIIRNAQGEIKKVMKH
ncbi:MAG: M6 family metalloprotease domain-containing protein [Prevotella sp.]|nr:M6 family metalloprotease domain-containing protein [Prevotella sp.]